MQAGQVSDPSARALFLPGSANLLFAETLPSQSRSTLHGGRRRFLFRPLSALIPLSGWFEPVELPFRVHPS